MKPSDATKAGERWSVGDGLQPGDRVLDLRAVTRSGGLFAGLVAAPLAAGMSGWWWGWCMLAAITGSVVGFCLAGMIGRLLFTAPPGETVVTQVGPAALAIALRASMAGGIVVSSLCAAVALGGAGVVPAVVASLAGLGVSVATGCLAALL